MNNRFGIHIISPTTQEASEAAQLVNSSGGDWGYITVLIEQKDKEQDKWITALKSRTEDFFVLNAGLDASAPHQPPNFLADLSPNKDPSFY